MQERTAIAVAAVRAVETTDRAHAVWTDADRAWASRAAAEVVGEAGDPHAFVGRRALLALERLASRKHRVARIARAWQWRPWVGSVLVVAAFALGALADAIGAPLTQALFGASLAAIITLLALYAPLRTMR